MTLPHDVQKLADVLPNYPKDIPVISFSVKGKAENSKVYHVRREKVQSALKWLVEHNPLYSGVTIDESRIGSLPENGPIEVQNVCVEEDESLTLPDLGPDNNSVFEDYGTMHHQLLPTYL